MLAAEPDSTSAANLAAHDVLPALFEGVTVDEVTNVFGSDFAKALQKLPPRRWSLPIRSEHGWHLVWLETPFERTHAGSPREGR